MPIPVHALAHRPLTAEAVAEFVALPAVPHIPDDGDAVDEELRRRGWSRQHELVCDSFLTGHGHVLCTDGVNPFGQPDARQLREVVVRPELSCTPLGCGPELPAADDADGLTKWISAHVDR